MAMRIEGKAVRADARFEHKEADKKSAFLLGKFCWALGIYSAGYPAGSRFGYLSAEDLLDRLSSGGHF